MFKIGPKVKPEEGEDAVLYYLEEFMYRSISNIGMSYNVPKPYRRGVYEDPFQQKVIIDVDWSHFIDLVFDCRVEGLFWDSNDDMDVHTAKDAGKYIEEAYKATVSQRVSVFLNDRNLMRKLMINIIIKYNNFYLSEEDIEVNIYNTQCV